MLRGMNTLHSNVYCAQSSETVLRNRGKEQRSQGGWESRFTMISKCLHKKRARTSVLQPMRGHLIYHTDYPSFKVVGLVQDDTKAVNSLFARVYRVAPGLSVSSEAKFNDSHISGSFLILPQIRCSKASKQYVC